MKLPDLSDSFKKIDDFILTAFNKGWFIWIIVIAIVLFAVSFCAKIK